MKTQTVAQLNAQKQANAGNAPLPTAPKAATAPPAPKAPPVVPKATEGKKDAKTTPPAAPKPPKAEKSLFTEKQQYFISCLKSSQCKGIDANKEPTWYIEDLVVELEATMNSMALGAMVTTLSQKGILTCTKETVTKDTTTRTVRVIRLTSLGHKETAI